MATCVCEHCQAAFSVADWVLKQRTPRFCSARCMGLAKCTPPIERQCLHCGATFTLRKSKKERAERLYCSLDCANKATGLAKRLPEKTGVCLHCGITFVLRDTHRQRAVQVYCSRGCANTAVSAWRPVASGSEHPLSKLTEVDIHTIFTMYHAGQDSYAIAKHFGVGATTILSVLHRKTWLHVPIAEELLALPSRLVFDKPYSQWTDQERRAYGRKSYAKNRDRRVAAGRVYKETHREQIRAQQRQHKKEWGATHREIIRARNKAQYRRNPERRRAYSIAYQKANPARAVASVERRRARKIHAPKNDLTLEQWQEILQVFRYKCAYCGVKLARPEQDHILSLAKGGSHTLSNIVPACRSCNASKHTGPPPVPVQPLLLTIAPSLLPQNDV
jgi:hypothetical protein